MAMLALLELFPELLDVLGPREEVSEYRPGRLLGLLEWLLSQCDDGVCLLNRP